MKKKEPADYLDLIARSAEEKRQESGNEEEVLFFPEPQGEKPVDYLAVTEAWDEVNAAKTGRPVRENRLAEMIITKERKVVWPARKPKPKESKVAYAENFCVGGLVYSRRWDLVRNSVNEDRLLYQDIHGRYVLDIRERYPLFDVWDVMYDHRYYHWYLVLEDGRLHIVYVDDGQDGAEITEDAEMIPYHAYQILVSDHYLDDQGHLQLS